MYSFEVVTEKMQEAGKRIEEKAGEFDLEWKKIYTALKVLGTEDWKGYASEEYASSLQKYKAEFETVSTEIREYARALQGKSKNYEDVENKIKNSVPNV